MILYAVQGNITDFTGDAIVNAANPPLLGGGGVDGAIHRAAGPELKAWIEQNVPTVDGVNRCPTSHVVVTPGFKLAAKHIIHTVGPVFFEQQFPDMLLEEAIRNVLFKAEELGVQSIAMPAISCGVYGGTILIFASLLEKVVSERPWNLESLTVVLFLDSEYGAFLSSWGQ